MTIEGEGDQEERAGVWEAELLGREGGSGRGRGGAGRGGGECLGVTGVRGKLKRRSPTAHSQ